MKEIDWYNVKGWIQCIYVLAWAVLMFAGVFITPILVHFGFRWIVCWYWIIWLIMTPIILYWTRK